MTNFKIIQWKIVALCHLHLVADAPCSFPLGPQEEEEEEEEGPSFNNPAFSTAGHLWLCICIGEFLFGIPNTFGDCVGYLGVCNVHSWYCGLCLVFWMVYFVASTLPLFPQLPPPLRSLPTSGVLFGRLVSYRAEPSKAHKRAVAFLPLSLVH